MADEEPFLSLLDDDELAMQYAILYPNEYQGASRDPEVNRRATRLWHEIMRRYPDFWKAIKVVDQARETLKMMGITENA